MIRQLLCTWLAALSLAPAARAEVRFDNVIASATLDRPVRYALYLPPGYGADSRDYPVLYLLHGGGTGQPSDWFTLAGIDHLLDRMIAAGEIRPLIAVAPDGRRDALNDVATYFLDDRDGGTRWETMFFADFIPAVETRHRAIGSGDARALLGISMGGVAAAVYQLRAPDSFAGAAALSSAFRTEGQLLALSPEGYESRYGGVLGSGLEGADRINSAWQALLPATLAAGAEAARFRRVPRLYFDIGADDPFFEATAALHVALRDAGVKHRFRVTEGGHDWPFWRGALESALRHVDAVLSRGYGE
ncbi:esterase family protein [Mangrovicoccus sp. HB161399]|uniref:alpha/beta hydrolase n=1 Tax=Mangrovicoccus sp. HB161399 TaxID=2720392 RepID=UPI001555EB46|nr:alpha/beta hydrolase-fold protein [Mangrovicoccus sp. HB161399]